MDAYYLWNSVLLRDLYKGSHDLWLSVEGMTLCPSLQDGPGFTSWTGIPFGFGLIFSSVLVCIISYAVAVSIGEREKNVSRDLWIALSLWFISFQNHHLCLWALQQALVSHGLSLLVLDLTCNWRSLIGTYVDKPVCSLKFYSLP